MPEVIRDGTGKGFLAKITSDNRMTTDAITEGVSSERSRKGKLFSIGTGSLNPTAAFSLGPVLWLRNDSNAEDLYIQKFVFGWDGGTTNFNRTIFSLIAYNTSEPTGANTPITDQIENISLSGSAAAVSSGVTTAHMWDETGTGMTGSTGGFTQVANRLAQGNTSVNIDGEIILGASNSIEMQVTPQETGLYNVAIVYYFAPAGLGRSFI
jgi:hypothetical protein